ncbi:hypothetical protein EW146_g752 [Bondarzewia mesenterica]|uniref:Nuclear pore complex protein Nup85 n=1 Tax=Bondarzewia mesenterica TaxID=1095465 RepID=A0A4S4M6F1_9AGAM|nr:hypothetical protein EW146_g752 [Bondarzewia mesenterica]
MDTIHLYPPLLDKGQEQEFVESGRSLSATISPRDNSLAVYATNSVDPQELRSIPVEFPQEQDIYIASSGLVPSSERRSFIAKTSPIFAAFQNVAKAYRSQSSGLLRDENSLSAMTKLAIDYVDFIRECWVHASHKMSDGDSKDADLYRSLYTCLSLFVVLYLPDSRLEDVPVGEELMEWLNTHFIEPSTEEGDQLSSHDRPWEDDSFWPYLTRTILRGFSKSSVFFLEVLSNRHPSSYVQSLAENLSPLLESHPRIIHFNSERDFVVASRRWKDKVQSLRLELDRVPEDARQDGFDNWWDRFSEIVGILEGRPEILQNVCNDLGADWKEICAAWGVFIDRRLRRQDLPEVVAQVLNEMPPDPTNLEDMVHAALLSGEPIKALSHAARLDIWLAAHLADILENVELLDAEVDEESELSLRQQYILAYAEYLRSDPALWRITVAYMCSCGDIGKERADQVLMRVPFSLVRPDGTIDSSAVGTSEDARSGEVGGILKEVIQTCFEYGREPVRRMVCAIAAQSFLRERNYGLAISYMTSAEDWTGLGRVVDRVLAEYISHVLEPLRESPRLTLAIGSGHSPAHRRDPNSSDPPPLGCLDPSS